MESTKCVLSNTKSELDNTNSELKITKADLGEAKKTNTALKTKLNAAVWETAVNAKKLNDKKDENRLLKVKHDRVLIERTRLCCENRITVEKLNDTIGVKEFEIQLLKKEVASLKQIAETQVRFIIFLLFFFFFFNTYLIT